MGDGRPDLDKCSLFLLQCKCNVNVRLLRIDSLEHMMLGMLPFSCFGLQAPSMLCGTSYAQAIFPSNRCGFRMKCPHISCSCEPWRLGLGSLGRRQRGLTVAFYCDYFSYTLRDYW